MFQNLLSRLRPLRLVDAVIVFAALPLASPAQGAKIATDLQRVPSASTAPTIDWARDVDGTRFVKVLIVSNSDDGGESRVRHWTAGIDVSGTLNPSNPSMQTWLGRIQNGFNAREDRYGHGSHVAAAAAGRGAYRSVDTTRMAPNAKLWDLRGLDDRGYGPLSDVLAGIDRVIYHARYKNARIVNLSLGADSTESYQTDPLAPAVRSAVAQ